MNPLEEQNSLFQRDLQIFWWPFFDSGYVFSLVMKNVIKVETFDFQKNYTRYENNFPHKIVHPKKIYKSMRDKKKMLEKKLFVSKRSTN